MSEVSKQTFSPYRIAWAVLTRLSQGRAEHAAGAFAPTFRYKDHGIGLEFSDKDRLTEFFQKTRELYPEHSMQTDKVFVLGDHVIMQWTLNGTFTEPFCRGLTRSTPVSIAGVSVVQTENGEITEWTDYYDGRTARRNALAAHFTDWGEY